MDYIFRRLALEYLPFESRSRIGLYSAAERTRALQTSEYTEDSAVEVDEFERSSEPVAHEGAHKLVDKELLVA